jgi:hypothetical protein
MFLIHNPRDGWMAITAVTTGEESFSIRMRMGSMTQESHLRESEPFVDNDRTFSYTRDFLRLAVLRNSSAGNPANPNGIYDTNNNVWDAKLLISTAMNIVITGPPHAGPFTSRIELNTGGTPSVNIANNATATFDVYISDINMNPTGGGTTVTAETSNGSVKVLGSGILGDEITLGGPKIIQLELKSSNTGTVDIPAKLNATIKWTGAAPCNIKEELILTYPGDITLTP